MKKLFIGFSLLLATVSTGPVSKSCGKRQAIGGAVNTTSGQVQGKASPLRPDVSAYLGIPYAKSPTGQLRFSPPQPVNTSSSVINATAYSPDCPCNRIPTNQAYIGGPAGEKILVALAQTGDPLDEDCLTVNVWTKPQSGEAKKAVLFWIYGGGFSTGNTANPIYDGSVLADENDVVVVSVNYRLNIFGFSGAPGVTPNVGLLDQRLALEWARDNVAAFGGDPSRITVFGQSAGGASVDYLSYAYPQDPIAHAYIPHSGVAGSAIGSNNNVSVQQNWYKASQSLGCGGAEAGEATVTCMRTKSWQDILKAVASQAPIALMSGFAPYADDRTVPSNVAVKGPAGQFAHLPFLTGSADNEAGFFVVVLIAYTNFTREQIALLPTAVIQPALDLFTLYSFTCPAAQAAEFRAQNNVPVWRYRYYGGNYTNTHIDFVGSDYHCSDLPLVFGTAESVTGIADLDYEAAWGKYQRSAWAAFAKDPQNGLASLGWPQYNPLTASLVRLAHEKETTASYIPNAEMDALCPALQSITNISNFLNDLISAVGSLLSGGTPSDLAKTLLDISSRGLSRDAALAALVAALQGK